MQKGKDYRITKLEKGPLQRFKNQNLLLKKFGEAGLQIYKAITGKRSSEELKSDLGLDDEMFYGALSFMEEQGMIKLEPAGPPGSTPAPVDEEIEVPEVDDAPEDTTDFEELPPEDDSSLEGEAAPLEDEIEPSSYESEEPAEEPAEEAQPEDASMNLEDEIKPITFNDMGEESEEEKTEEPEPPEEPPEDEDSEKEAQEPEEYVPESESEEESEPEEPEPTDHDIELEKPESKPLPSDDEGLSPVEKIIKDKYGDTGLRVYALIDGARTAEQIMNDTGLTEAKLVEILDFMDEQGIIKLDYPKGKPPPPRESRRGPGAGRLGGSRRSHGRRAPTPPKEKISGGGFNPMIESDDALEEVRGIASPVEIPLKAPVDLIKSVQMKTKTMLKFGKKGGKVTELINGKNDVIDIAIKSGIPLYEVSEVLSFLLENGFILLKPLTRSDVHDKYGDDGYAVYKVYGKEGLMLYELIGKELTIKQMADKITKERGIIVDMFIFIHQVLGIELPIDKEVLLQQLELK